MGIRIVTDSTSDITQADAARLDIDVIPLQTLFGDQVYRDGIDMTAEEFFPQLAMAKKLPTTSQPNPSDFEQAFRRALSNGDQIITICMASNLSGTMQSAEIARESCGTCSKDIWIIDSKTTALALLILVHHAITLRDQGMPAEEIVAEIEREKTSLRIVAALDTLEYLYKGGRLSRTTATTGALLNIKPVVALEDGEIKNLGTALGLKKAYDMVFKNVEKTGGIDFAKPVSLGYTANKDRFTRFEEMYWKSLGGMATGQDSGRNPRKNAPRNAGSDESHDPIIVSIGSVLGTHVGPGAAAIAFFRK